MKKCITILLLFFLASCGISYISVNSNPPNANVYVISKWKSERKPFILNDINYLKKYQINEGLTPVVTKVKIKRYIVVTTLNGRFEFREADTASGDTTKISVTF